MTVIFEPKIEATIDSHMPDNWDLSLGIRLPDDFVVSRHRDGSVASRRKDLRWDLTMYQPRGNPLSLFFSYWVSGRSSSKRKMKAQELTAKQVSRVDDIQHLMSLIIYKKRGGMVGPEMLRKFSAALCRIASHADNHGLAIPELLGDPQHLKGYCRVIPENHCAELAHLLGIFISLDPELDVGFPVAGNAVIKDRLVRAKAHLDKYRQTPPIPSRIYSSIIKNLSIELDEFSAVADKYLQLTQDYFGGSRDRNRHGNYDVKVHNLIQDYGLVDYFESKNLSKTHTGISSGLTEIQMVCKLIIHAFSGMRNQEALSLPYHCLETEISHSRTHFLLCGQTTKLNRGKIRRTRWVTVEEGHRAVEVARCIANVIYKIIGDSPKKSISLINQYPLFVTTGYLGVIGKNKLTVPGFTKPMR